MNWFTADWHLGDTRYGWDDPLFRPFHSIEEQHDTILSTLNRRVQMDDTLYHLGDVAVTLEAIPLLERVYCQNRVLILGNYDTDDAHKMPLLKQYFKAIYHDHELTLSNGEQVYLNHYPEQARADVFNITGHIHSLWKVQPNMLNVGVDVWHFEPVSETKLLYTVHAMRNHYDKNVFPNQ